MQALCPRFVWRHPTFNAETETDDSFKELAAALARYDVADLLSTAGALHLLPANASRITRLEALSHSIASLPFKSGPRISPGKLREICKHPSLQSIAHLEDPAENQFAEEFAFFGGSYVVFPGIAQGGTFMLSNLCAAIFLDRCRLLPRDFTSEAFRVASTGLKITNAVAQKAGIRRGTAPASNLHKDIVVPNGHTLRRLKTAVEFTNKEVNALLSSSDLIALNPLLSKAGYVNLQDYDIANGPLLWKPFVEAADGIVLVIPGMVVSAIRQAVVALAIESRLQIELAKAYNEAGWRAVKESFSYTRNLPFRSQQ